MPKKTEGVEELVSQVLPSIPRPYSEDVIDHVCMAIQLTPQWLAEYDSLVRTLSLDVVNNWIGQYVAAAVGGQRIRQVRASCRLIKSYSKLRYG